MQCGRRRNLYAPRHFETQYFTVAVLAVSVLIGAAATAQAATLTVFFSGTVDLTLMGGPRIAHTAATSRGTRPRRHSRPNRTPSSTRSSRISCSLTALTETLLGPGGSGLVVGNDGELDGGPGGNDALLFLAGLDTNVTINGVTGDTLFVLGFVGDQELLEHALPPNGLQLPFDAPDAFFGSLA